MNSLTFKEDFIMSKIVVLNSGGFDSVLMAHVVREEYPDTEIHDLFFDYGQKSVQQERECSTKVSEKLGFVHHEIKLPTLTWSSSDFYNDGFSGANEYLEMRNLIFLSYALSFCESQGCSHLYLAVLKSLGYYDTSEAFIEKVNSIANDIGVHIVTPFSKAEKLDLDMLAFKYEIGENEFFSCDNPVDGKPCGKCPDCVVLKEVFSHVKLNTPAKVWCKKFDPNNELFQDLIKKSPVDEIRVLVNNSCQLKCQHCYYGFEDMKQERLSLDEFRELFVQSKELGIKSFHFSGKEPLFDDFIFDVSKVAREIIPDADLTVVTNGINIPKFAEELKAYNYSKVFLSVDDVKGYSHYRQVSNVTHRALTALNKVEIPVEVFIDLHEVNFDKVPEIIDFLYTEYGVKSFYVRTISLIGSAKDFTPLNSEQLNVTYEQLYEYTKGNTDITVNMTIMANYVYDLLDSKIESPLYGAVNSVIDYANRYITPNFSVFPELYCGKYETQITVTPDGYVHGCASEVSVPNYDEISAGNVRDLPLKDLIQRGKDLCIHGNCQQVDDDGNLKFFSCIFCTPLDL